MACPHPSLPPVQKNWLLRPGALTVGLRGLGTLHLRVTRETATGLMPQEAALLNCPVGSAVWVREVLMSINGCDSVFARSFALLRDTWGVWQGMRRLRSRPLADMLYHDARIVRSPFCVARLGRQDPAYRALLRTLPGIAVPAQAVLARYSIFHRQARPLLVMECFLPAFWQDAAKGG